LSLSVGVLSQSSDQSLHSWYEEKKSNPLDELSPSVHEFQDPYAVFLESDRESILFNRFVHKFSWDFHFSSSLLFFIHKKALVENANNNQIAYLIQLVVPFHLIR